MHLHILSTPPQLYHTPEDLPTAWLLSLPSPLLVCQHAPMITTILNHMHNLMHARTNTQMEIDKEKTDMVTHTESQQLHR